MTRPGDGWIGSALRLRPLPAARRLSIPRPAASGSTFVTSQANHARQTGQLDAAEKAYREILGKLEGQAVSPEHRRSLAGFHHNVGMVAQDRGRLEEAEGWYRKALGTAKDVGDRPEMAR